jgi:hypothetical protein
MFLKIGEKYINLDGITSILTDTAVAAATIQTSTGVHVFTGPDAEAIRTYLEYKADGHTSAFVLDVLAMARTIKDKAAGAVSSTPGVQSLATAPVQ